MSKIGLIISREFKTRVRKKSFIVMTILGPILFAAFMLAPAVLLQLEDDDAKIIAVLDEAALFVDDPLENTENLTFDFVTRNYLTKDGHCDVISAKSDLKDSEYYALLYIPANIVSSNKGGVQIFSYQQPNESLKLYVSKGVEKKVEDAKFLRTAEDYKIPLDTIKMISAVKETSINVVTTIIKEDGSEENSSTTLAMIIGYLCGFLIYMFIFMYGSMVMTGVIEEKSSRIVEVIVSSVRPFQLMMGKILGVALVGVTQFVLWILLTAAIVFTGFSCMPSMSTQDLVAQSEITTTTIAGQTDVNADDMGELQEIVDNLKSVNYVAIILMFLFYFVGGYLLYGAMFAIAGSAVDNEADTQQFTLPITIPLMLAIFVMITAIKNPDGSLVYWFSIIPFTSPVVMLARFPFGVPVADVLISMGLLVLTFVLFTWIAAKIYRVGILMYGKKVNYKELWKWLKYKN
ncbi:MAG: ABC transporter permease [Bacteroidales bacterium]|nr:ABC transporter permease [Bacteroidales bacterium]